MKTECDYLNGWIENSHICKNLTKIVNPRAGEHRREEDSGGGDNCGGGGGGENTICGFNVIHNKRDCMTGTCVSYLDLVFQPDISTFQWSLILAELISTHFCMTFADWKLYVWLLLSG